MVLGLGTAILDTMPMHHTRVPTLVYHSPVSSPLSHCRRMLAMHEYRVPTSHLLLRCNMATGPPIYLHPLVQRPPDPFRHIQQLLHVCHSRPRKLINSLFLDLHLHGRRPHHHQVLHPARAIEPLAFLQRYRAPLFQPRQKQTVRRRLLHEPWIEGLCHLQGCQSVGTQCSQECLLLLLEQRNGINGVDQAFLP